MLADLLLAFVVSIVMTGLFGLLFRQSGTWLSRLALLPIFFLGTWAGGVWLPAFGPKLLGVAWLPFLVVGLDVLLLVTAASPVRVRTVANGAARSSPRSRPASRTSIVFGLFVGLLLVAIVVAYV